MLSRSSRFDPCPALRTLLLVAGLVTGLSAGALAADDEPPPRQEAEASAHATPNRTFHLNGTVITWDLQEKSFKAPTAEQAAWVAEELRKMMEEGRGVFAGADEPIEVKTMAGLQGARFPLRLMSASIVHFDEDGHVVGQACTDAAAAHEPQEPSKRPLEVK